MTVDTMELTAHQKVFEAIRKHPSITVKELSKYLGKTPADIRHHISILLSYGVIERIDHRRQDGRGRPEVIYAISAANNSDGLVNLIEGILSTWIQRYSADILKNELKRVGYQLIGSPNNEKNISITLRLAKSIQILSGLGYQAHWEAGVSGPRISLGTCPYRRIIQNHPELCHMDQYLIEELIGINIFQISKLEKDERGLSSCIFSSNY